MIATLSSPPRLAYNGGEEPELHRVAAFRLGKETTLRALVVDDSKPVRCILAKMLRALDFEVVEAADGKEGLARLHAMERPDVATVNWQMPVMNGIEFVQAVRADSRYRDLPLLMISSERSPEEVARAEQVGANAYLAKPCTTRCLTQQLESMGVLSQVTPCLETEAPVAASSGKCQRVLIVDDSAVVRRVVSAALEEDSDLSVAGTACDGLDALEQIDRLTPDVVLLDIEMPRMDGFETLKRLRKTHPDLPVIMFSTLTERGAVATMDALLLGAKDYVAKPGGARMRDVDAGRQAICERLIPKIKQFGTVDWAGKRSSAGERPIATQDLSLPVSPVTCQMPRRVDVMAIALSTGGPQILHQYLPTIARDGSVPILIVQHMPPLFTKHLADRLAADGRIDVREASDGDALVPGRVLIAPGDFHMTVESTRTGHCVRLNQNDPERSCRPSADVLFRSVAEVFEASALAAVFTGMGCDGMLGCQSIRDAGGQVLVQDEATSVVWGMPGSVANRGIADAVLPVDLLAKEIARRSHLGRPFGQGRAKS